MENIRPLRGQVLVRLVPPDYQFRGIILPDIAQFAFSGDKAFARQAIVVRIGPWRQTKQGLHILPDFHAGQRVIISEYLGTRLSRGVSEQLRLIRIDDVLAIVEEELTGPPTKP